MEFLKRYPGIAAQASQRMIASHLGASPETLSRVRKHCRNGYFPHQQLALAGIECLAEAFLNDIPAAGCCLWPSGRPSA